MNFTDFTQYAIVAAVLSVVVQYIKNYLQTSPAKTRAIVIAASAVLAAGFYFVKDTSIWQPLVSIFGIANTVYLYLIKPFEN